MFRPSCYDPLVCYEYVETLTTDEKNKFRIDKVRCRHLQKVEQFCLKRTIRTPTSATMRKLDVCLWIRHPNFLTSFRTVQDEEAVYLISDFPVNGRFVDYFGAGEHRKSEEEARAMIRPLLLLFEYLRIAGVRLRCLTVEGLMVSAREQLIVADLDFEHRSDTAAVLERLRGGSDVENLLVQNEMRVPDDVTGVDVAFLAETLHYLICGEGLPEERSRLADNGLSLELRCLIGAVVEKLNVTTRDFINSDWMKRA